MANHKKSGQYLSRQVVVLKVSGPMFIPRQKNFLEYKRRQKSKKKSYREGGEVWMERKAGKGGRVV